MKGGIGADAPTKVLVVDDDSDFRHSTARTLTAHGYVCVEAASGEEARVVLDADGDVAAVLCDIRMPGESGLKLLSDLTADFPDTAVVMTTGVDSTDTADAAFGVWRVRLPDQAVRCARAPHQPGWRAAPARPGDGAPEPSARTRGHHRPNPSPRRRARASSR